MAIINSEAFRTALRQQADRIFMPGSAAFKRLIFEIFSFFFFKYFFLYFHRLEIGDFYLAIFQ